VPREFIFMSEDSDLLEWRPTKFGLAPKTRKRQRRIHKVTPASEIKKLQKAGVMQGRVTVNGVTVEFGHQISNENFTNSWDEVLSNVTH
jgi:hypothetical protein